MRRFIVHGSWFMVKNLSAVLSGFLVLTMNYELSTMNSKIALAAAEDPLAALQADFLEGRYGVVLDRTQELLRRDSTHREDALFLQGISALKVRELDLARSSLERLLADYPQSRWFPHAWMARAEVDMLAGEYGKALAAYERLLQEERALGVAPQARLRLAQVQRKLGLWNESRATLQALMAQAPNSLEAAQAGNLLQAEDFFFSVQVGAFATQTNAVRLKEELQRRGYEAAISLTAMQGKEFHRVRVGQFARREEAEGEADRLKKEGFPGKVVP